MQQSLTGGLPAPVEQLLHHGQQTGHRSPRNAGSGFKAIERFQSIVDGLQRLEVSRWRIGYRKQRLNVVKGGLSAWIENAVVPGSRRQRKVIARDNDLIGAHWTDGVGVWDLAKLRKDHQARERRSGPRSGDD